jgi:hypothetical protein
MVKIKNNGFLWEAQRDPWGKIKLYFGNFRDFSAVLISGKQWPQPRRGGLDGVTSPAQKLY